MNLVPKIYYFQSKNPITVLLNHTLPISNVNEFNNFWAKFEITAYSVLVDLVLVYAMYYYLADLG